MELRLKELRTRKNLYQKDVAAMLGVDRTTYAKYETGDSEPNLEMLSKMADFFEVSLGYIAGIEEKEKPIPVSEDGRSELDEDLISRLIQLNPDEIVKVDAFVQGLLAAREV